MGVQHNRTGEVDVRVLVMWEDPSEEQEAHQLAAKLIRAEQAVEDNVKHAWGGRPVAVVQSRRVPRILTRAVDYNEIMRSGPTALAMDVTLGQWDGK